MNRLAAENDIPVEGKEHELSQEGPMKRYDSLKDAGIDPGEGMKYCLNDPMLNQSLSEEYADGCAEKA